MYALYPYSGSTPGKQCQRARADGRKHGDKLANLVGDLLVLGEHDDDCDYGIDGDVRRMTVLSSTLDLHDRSLWHPNGLDNILLFPKSCVVVSAPRVRRGEEYLLAALLQARGVCARAGGRLCIQNYTTTNFRYCS